MMKLEEHPALDIMKQELAEIEAVVNTYSLADAIREGSKHTGQCVGNWYNEQGEVCALSAAFLALEARGL